MEGNGNDIWGSSDEGYFIYPEKSGSWSLSGKVIWIDSGTDVDAKLGLMIRKSGDNVQSANFFVQQRGNNYVPDQISAQSRTFDGAETTSQEVTDLSS